MAVPVVVCTEAAAARQSVTVIVESSLLIGIPRDVLKPGLRVRQC